MDLALAVPALLLVAPLLVALGVLVKLESPGPAVFRQVRIGRRYRPFRIAKLRTMRTEGHPDFEVTVGEDPRITRVGRFLRGTKMDELPQLWNVVRGDMSLVGPRPEVPGIVEADPDAFRDVLVVRPGITDLASLRFVSEADLLARAPDPKRFYMRRVLPKKLRLARFYVRRRTLCLDAWILYRTARTLMPGGRRF